MAKTEAVLKPTSIKKVRAKFLFDDGEFKHRVVEMKKRKRLEQIKEEETEEEYLFYINHVGEVFYE